MFRGKAGERMFSGDDHLELGRATMVLANPAIGFRQIGSGTQSVVGMLTRLIFGLSVATSGLAASQAWADEPAGSAAEVSYHKVIRPLFQANCHGCHQPAKAGGNYVMTSFESLLKGGESGEAAVIAGQPDKSELLSQIVTMNGQAAMPKGKPPLTPAQVDLVRRWIAAGAKDDSPKSARPQYDSERPPVYQAPPVLTSVDYSPDGQLLAISGYHEVLLTKADGSELVARLVGLSERIESAKFSPDGKRLAVTGGSPGRMGEVQIWDVATKKLTYSLTVGFDTIYGASWSPNGKYVAFGCPDNTVRAIEADTGKQVFFNGAHNDWVLDTTFSVNSDHVISVSRDMSMKLIEFGTQRFIDNITSITPGALKGGLSSVCRHPTKDELLVGGADGAPKVYKMVRDKARQIGDNSNLIREYPALPGRLFAVTFSADGQRIAAASSLDGKGEVRVYSAADGAQVWKAEFPTGGIFSVAFSVDGKTVACGGFDGQVRLLDAGTGQVLKSFFPAPIGPAVAAK
ncbi:MAG: c-type cytochrome domain-containing protein [Pirellulales bacterium]